MNISVIILTAVLLLTIIAPFGVYNAIRFAKKGDFIMHRKIQNTVFFVCLLGVLALEMLIRVSGGSGSLAGNSAYSGTAFFRTILIAHIIGAILTYLVWIYQIIISNSKFRKTLPGNFTVLHKKTGYVLFIGLIYTAVTALAVYLMTLNLI